MQRGGMVAWLVVVAAGSAILTGSLGLAGDAGIAGSMAVTPLGIEARQISQVATSPNGQTVYGIDESRRSVVAIDPFAVGRCREVVGPVAEGRPHPVSLAALPGDIVAVVCRAADAWSLLSYRTRPGESVDAAQPLQEVLLGRGDGLETAAMAVSRTRDWFAVVGLPPPLPPVVRAAFAGAGVRRLPREPSASGRSVAVAVGPADELVTLEASGPGAAASLVSTAHGGRELLRLDTGLADVRGAAFARDGSSLWVIAGEVGGDGRQPAGLWRLDAVMREGRQAVRPSCVVRLADPRAVAAVSDHSLVVVHGTQPQTISRIDMTVDDDVVDPKEERREEGER
jgi:hypothetical protein